MLAGAISWGFKSPSPHHFRIVRTGHIGNRLFLRHREHFWAEGIFEGLQSSFLQFDITQVVIHEADEPYSVVNFFNAHSLAARDLLSLIFLR